MTDAADQPATAGHEEREGSTGAKRPAPASAAVLTGRWSAWPATALERLPLPYALTVALLSLLALGEQLLEYSIERAAVGAPPAISPARLVVFPILVAYVLGQVMVLKGVAVKALAELRTAVLVSDEDYESYVRRMVSANRRMELLLLVVSVVVVLTLFVGMRADLLNTNRSLPHSVPAAAYIILMYVLLGWLLLTVAYTSIRHGRALYALAHQPLAINVFDPTSLEPFGRLGLMLSLPIVGVVLVPLILFGAPTKGGYVVILLSAVSFLALFVPLWGVHQQIERAHKRALVAIHSQLQEIQDILLQGIKADVPDLGALTSRTGMLIQLRKTIQEAPKWPFRDSAGLARAVVAVSSPLVYFVLDELIQTYLLPFFGVSP